MIDLVRRCLERDEQAWGEFFLVAERVGLRAIRRVLRKFHLVELELDVLQEI